MNATANTITITKRNGETFSFTTKHTVNSACAVGLPTAARKGNDFAASLLNAQMRWGRLSEAQEKWALFLGEKFDPTVEKADAPSTDAPAFATLVEWFHATGLKTPRITLDINGCTLKVAMAGSRSKYCGALQITDGKPFGENQYWGRVEADGTARLTSNCPEWVLARLTKWNADPASILEEAKAHGHRTGNCCFCSRDLETRESVTVGYGPICADKYGLPWGVEVDREPVEITA